MRKYCLDPIIDQRSRILLLGTLPGDKSLRQGTYYADESNHFWDFMYRLLQPGYPPLQPFDHRTTAQKRYQFLLDNGIALWDVIADCIRDSSTDNKITDPRFNNVAALINGTAIQHIFCTHKKAHGFLRKAGQLPKLRHLPVTVLYSSSSSNRKNTFAVFHQWQQQIGPLLQSHA